MKIRALLAVAAIALLAACGQSPTAPSMDMERGGTSTIGSGL